MTSLARPTITSLLLLALAVSFPVAGVLTAPAAAAVQEEPPAAEPSPEAPAPAETEPADDDAEEAAEETGAEEAEEPEDPDRIAFTLQLEDDQGTVSGTTGSLDFVREDYAVLAGGVVVEHEDLELRAERAEIDLATQEVVASGNVVLDQGPRRLAGATLTFDLDTKTGKLTEASAYVDPDYYFSGAEIAKIDDDVYTVVDGIFTSCEGDEPDWSFRLGEARVELEEYARVKNASLRAKRLPLFYTPYLLWPTKSERASGLLVPNIGFSDRRGAYLGLAYFQELGRSYDTTIYLDTYSEGFVGIGDELRYQPTPGTAGKFEGYVIRDQELREWRWRADLEHVTEDLPFGMRGVVDWTEYSDFAFFQDFERDFDRNSRRFEESRAFASGNWGPHLLNVLVADRETFTSTGTRSDQRLPEIEYRLRQRKLGRTPLYLTVDSSLAYLSVDRTELYAADYGRFDLFPELSLPLNPFPWLSVTLTAGERFTWYGDSLITDPDEAAAAGSSFSGEELTRTAGRLGAAVIGPSFSRIFDAEIGGYARFKHIIEPRILYGFSQDYDDQDRVPTFDEIDPLFGSNTARVSLINRVKAKPAEEGEGVREVVTFELSQRYSFEDDEPLSFAADGRTSKAGPLEAELRFNPSRSTTVRTEARWDVLEDGLRSTSLSGTYRSGGNDVSLYLTTRFRPEDGETLSNQMRLTTGFTVLPGRLGLRASVNYDFEQQLLQEQRYFLDYTSQCYGIRLELRDFQAGLTRDTDYRVAFTLKNVGTFLDLTGRFE